MLISKINNRSIAVDLSRQTKGIRCRSKSNLTKWICWTIKNLDVENNATDAGDNDQFMFVLTIWKK